VSEEKLSEALAEFFSSSKNGLQIILVQCCCGRVFCFFFGQYKKERMKAMQKEHKMKNLRLLTPVERNNKLFLRKTN